MLLATRHMCDLVFIFRIQVCSDMALDGNCPSYVVKLFDTSGAEDILIADELANDEHATRTGSAGVKVGTRLLSANLSDKLRVAKTSQGILLHIICSLIHRFPLM